MEWIGLILQIILLGFFLIWEGYNKKKGENLAMKEDSREINYEGEKGKNLATKEDIAQITQELEKVKNEISFESQRKHTFIERRTNRMINILYLSEKFFMYGSLLYSFLNDKYSDKEMSILIKDINDGLLDLCHECRLASVTFEDKKILEGINNLRNGSTKYATFIGSTAIAGLNYIRNWQKTFELANENNNNGAFLNSSKECIEQLNKVIIEYENKMFKEDKALKQHIEEYASLLRTLYKHDFYLKSDFMSINEEKRDTPDYYKNQVT